MYKYCSNDSAMDDTVTCLYFLVLPHSEHLIADLNETVDKISTQYFWHKDELKIVKPLLKDEIDCLYSCTCYGDNIEDEWFIVYIMFELSKIYNIVIQITDSDGDFLLIEAADYLPKWLNPENSENRVFIYNGEIHIIPETLIKTEIEIKLKDAVDIIIDPTKETKANIEIQKAIMKRVSDYPTKINENLHKGLVKLPLELAAVLSYEPKLISPIVNAYCSHDIIDAKLCKKINYDDSICTNVTFTKCQYAMLLHSKIMSTVPLFFKTKDDRQSQLGLKLFCGYKIIMAASTHFKNSKSYRKFIDSLKQNGYFKENIEGSKEYTNLLNTANDYYISMLNSVNENTYDTINQIKSSEDFEKHKSMLLSQDESLLTEDDSSWLDIHPEQLNDMLMSRYGKQVKFRSEITPDEINSQIGNFLNQASDYEGIEVNKKDEELDIVDFEPDKFGDALENILKLLSSTNVSNEDDDMFSDEDYVSNDEDVTELDTELQDTLSSDILKKSKSDSKKVTFDNMIQSLNEQGGLPGPTSNLLNTIGLKRNDLLDSDDDSE